MCGICGFYSKKNISMDQLTAMNDTMRHRGPDDRGTEIFCARKEYTVGLAQRRLSILDLSPLGHQPMHSKDGRVSIVFNGEIYNFKELKEELSDYPYVSTCDTEVILAAYLKWGLTCVRKLRGMFAIAIYDRDEDKLYLIRDRIGKKPLYYYEKDGDLIFASELKPIINCPGFVPVVRKEVLSRYLYQQYLCGPDSILEHVYKVRPGQIVCFSYGEVTKYQYWDIKQIYKKKYNDNIEYEDAKEELKDLLRDAVGERLVADVPVGTFLSGGYDSSLITAIAQEISKEPVKTFSIGFHEEKYNEAGYAKEVAKHLGCQHTEMYIGEEDMFSLVEQIPRFYDEPFADSSQIPSMLVSSLAKKDVTVVLSGDGGDELFCGYNIYEKVKQAQQLDKLGAVAAVVGDALRITDKYPFKVRVIAKNRNKEAKTQFVSGNYLDVANQMVLSDVAKNSLPCYYDFESIYEEENWQVRRMLLDMETYLPEDILCKVDRASMMYSLEARCPILDQRVIEYALRLPHEFKYKAGVKKRILKDLAYDYVPRELLERPKKGFSVPLDKWLRGPLREQVLSMSGREYLTSQGVFDADYVSSFLESYMRTGDAGAGTGANYSHMVWAYFMFQKWYETYIRK